MLFQIIVLLRLYVAINLWIHAIIGGIMKDLQLLI